MNYWRCQQTPNSKLCSPMRPWYFKCPRTLARSNISTTLNFAPLPVRSFRRVWLLRRPEDARCSRMMTTSVSGDHTKTSRQGSSVTDARTWWGYLLLMRVLLFKVLPLDLCVIDDHELETLLLPFWEKCSAMPAQRCTLDLLWLQTASPSVS